MSQLDDLCQAKGMQITYKRGDKPAWSTGQSHYRVVLTFQKRRMTVDFWTNGLPNVADVLSSLLLDASAGRMGFGNFCDEFGYDPDSRKIEKMYKACEKIVPKLERFLGAEYDSFQNAEH